jgi:hypothetical protein
MLVSNMLEPRRGINSTKNIRHVFIYREISADLAAAAHWQTSLKKRCTHNDSRRLGTTYSVNLDRAGQPRRAGFTTMSRRLPGPASLRLRLVVAASASDLDMPPRHSATVTRCPSPGRTQAGRLTGLSGPPGGPQATRANIPGEHTR